MFEYGALFNSSFSEQLQDGWYRMAGFVGDLPFYWYIVIFVVLILLFKLFIKA